MPCRNSGPCVADIDMDHMVLNRSQRAGSHLPYQVEGRTPTQMNSRLPRDLQCSSYRGLSMDAAQPAVKAIATIRAGSTGIAAAGNHLIRKCLTTLWHWQPCCGYLLSEHIFSKPTVFEQRTCHDNCFFRAHIGPG